MFKHCDQCREHRSLVDGEKKSLKYRRERTHTKEFYKWVKEEIRVKDNFSKETRSLVRGPNRTAKKLQGYVINGYRFHSKKRDNKCTTQNSGVFLTALTSSFASAKDQNPIVGNVNYYGAIQEILEIDYWGVLNVVLFRCCWYQEEKDSYGLTRVNFQKLRQKSDPFVLASQVHQVFYVEDPTEKGIHYVIKTLPREWSDMGDENISNEENRNEQDVDDHIHIDYEFDNQEMCVSWCRDDLPAQHIPIDKHSNIRNDPDDVPVVNNLIYISPVIF